MDKRKVGWMVAGLLLAVALGAWAYPRLREGSACSDENKCPAPLVCKVAPCVVAPCPQFCAMP